MIYLACIIGYLILLAAIGVWKSRQVKSQDDFAVAGRSLSPWVMVCTMLAVWIGTGSIVGNAEQTYKAGMAALILPVGTFIGMVLLSLIASRARKVGASTVPEIIAGRFGQGARGLAVISLVIAYMVIVSYQFNAGGAVLEVITGNKPPVAVGLGDELSRDQLVKGRLVFTPGEDWKGTTRMSIGTSPGERQSADRLDFAIEVVSAGEIVAASKELSEVPNRIAVKENSFGRLRYDADRLTDERYVVLSLPEHSVPRGRRHCSLELVEPILTARKATLIAAVFIVAYTALAGLMSLAYMDVVTGTIITVSLLIAVPVYFVTAGGFGGMEASFAAMGDKPQHMQFWGVYSTTDLINFCLPPFLLVLGDANQYQRIFASRSAKGARTAVTTMIFAACVVELLIIVCAWVAGSMTPDPENGKYILIYAAHRYLPLSLGCLFMVTVVGIIVSTADSFLLVPATTVVNDVYLSYINPKAPQRRTLLLSRSLVVVFGVIAYVVSLAFAESTGFFEKALYAYTIYGASITPSLVAAIVWKGATKAGAVSSILAGVAVSLLWSEAEFIQERLPAAVSGLDAVLPAISVSVACLVGVSLLTGNQGASEDV